MFGRMEFVPQPVVIDEGTLKQISDITGGKYFRATGNKVLADIFAEIDRLETSEIDVRHFSHTEDIYFPWAMVALDCSFWICFSAIHGCARCPDVTDLKRIIFNDCQL